MEIIKYLFHFKNKLTKVFCFKIMKYNHYYSAWSYFLFRNFILIHIKEDFKSSDYECRDTNKDYIRCDHKREFDYSPNTLVLLLI